MAHNNEDPSRRFWFTHDSTKLTKKKCPPATHHIERGKLLRGDKGKGICCRYTVRYVRFRRPIFEEVIHFSRHGETRRRRREFCSINRDILSDEG